MRDFICRNCFKKSKAEWDNQIFCRRPTCIDKDEKSKPTPKTKVYAGAKHPMDGARGIA